MVIPQDINLFVFSQFSHCLGATYNYCRLGTVCSCRCRDMVCSYRSCDTAFICVRVIQTSKIYRINDKKSNQWSLICYRTGIICIIIIIVILNV